MVNFCVLLKSTKTGKVFPLECFDVYGTCRTGQSITSNNIPHKALPVLVCAKNTVLGDVSRDKYSTRLCLVLYVSVDTPPRAVFSVQTHGSALSNIYSILLHYEITHTVKFSAPILNIKISTC